MPSNEIGNELTSFNEAQASGGPDSERRSEDQSGNSVRDFLYHDVRRIASFLAQFHTYGVLQQVKATEAVGRSGASKTVISGDVGVPMVAKGTATMDGTVTEEERDSAEHVYDPLWTNAQALLDYLSERGMIIRDLSSARIGQFVLVSGKLATFDLGILREAWKMPAIKAVIGKELSKSTANEPHNRAERRTARHKPQTGVFSEAESALALLGLLPHTIQATIRSEDHTIWSSL